MATTIFTKKTLGLAGGPSRQTKGRRPASFPKKPKIGASKSKKAGDPGGTLDEVPEVLGRCSMTRSWMRT